MQNHGVISHDEASVQVRQRPRIPLYKLTKCLSLYFYSHVPTLWRQTNLRNASAEQRTVQQCGHHAAVKCTWEKQGTVEDYMVIYQGHLRPSIVRTLRNIPSPPEQKCAAAAI